VQPERAASDAASNSRIAHVTLRGTAWSLASRLLGKGMVLISTIILARLLGKDDFGVAAYAISLIAIFSTLPAMGLGPAMIVHGRDDEKVLSTGFWIGLAAGALGFAVVWVLAPFSASIFGDDRAVAVTRALGLVFPIESLRNAHASVMSQRLAFRKRVGPEFAQSLAKGVGAIGLALSGWGAMALIGGTLIGAAVSVPAYWIVSGWRPRFQVDSSAARRLVRYGSPLVGTGVLGAIIRNLDYLVIGRLLGATALGLYVLGFRLPDLLVRQICQVLSQVLLPVYARFGSDRDAIARACATTLAYVFAITAPMSIGIALVAVPTVDLLFGPEWHEAAGVVTPIAIYTLFVSISFNVGDAFKACDRPDVLLRLSLLRGLVALPALTGAAYGFGSPTAVGWAQAGVALVAVAATLVAARAVFGLSILRALRGLLPIAAACAVMSIGVAIALRGTAAEDSWAQLAVSVPIGMICYLVSLRRLAPDFFESGLRTLRGAMSRGPKWAAEVAP
jgi:O-antigen/teichoic acid export membrane protein